METFISSLNNKTHRIRDIARVPDKTLQTLYVKAGLKPIEVLSGIDKNGKDIIVMYFLKEESQKYYDMWINHTLSDYLATVGDDDV